MHGCKTVDVMRNLTTDGVADAPRPKVRLVQGLRIKQGTAPSALRDEFTYSIIEAAPLSAVPGDKRRTERLRTRLRGGLLSDRRNAVIVDCLIQDRSRTGARLRLAQERPLPKVFLLSDEVSKTQLWAQLAWQKGRDAGVRFVTL